MDLLVRRAVAGDAAAFAELTEPHRASLVRFCRRLLPEQGAAQDLAQETLLRAYQSLDRLETPERFAAWLYGIAANVAKMWWRQHERRPLSLDDPAAAGAIARRAHAFPVPALPEEIIEYAELIGRLRCAITALPPALAHVVVLRYVDGLSYRDLAETLRLPVSTVKSRLFESRARLRRELVAELPPTVRRAARTRARKTALTKGAAIMATRTAPQQERAKEETNKAVVQCFYEQFVNGGDLRAVGELIHPALGEPQVVADRVRAWRAALPDGRRTIEDIIAEGDRVVVRYMDRGTHQGAFFGVQATGRTVEYGGTWVLRLVDGKIAEGWHTMDTLGLLQQLGATVTLPDCVWSASFGAASYRSGSPCSTTHRCP